MPQGWDVEVDAPDEGNRRPDSRFVLRGPQGTFTTIVVEQRDEVSPRAVQGDLAPRMLSARSLGGHLPFLVVARWLSKRTQELLAEEGIGYIDLTGNALLRIDNPPFYLQTAGAERNPWPKERGRAQVRGPKAARLIRLLVDVRPPYGVQQISAATGLAAGYVSRLLDTLYGESLIERGRRGPVESVDIGGLVHRWAESYDVLSTNEAQSHIATGGLPQLLERIASDPAISTRTPITGSFAATRLAPIASPALLLAYHENPELLAQELGLLPADEGGNVTLLRPFDPIVFARTKSVDGVLYAAPSQIAVDCLTGTGRMPAEGESVLGWMQEHESSWRVASIAYLLSEGAA